MGLFGHELIHLLSVVLVGVPLFYKFKNFKGILFLAFISIGMDADHLFDYGWYLFHHADSLIPDVRYFLSGAYFNINKLIFIPIHAWEWVLISFLLYKWKKNEYCLYFSSGVAAHLVVDSLTNHVIWQTFILTYRSLLHFDQLLLNKY